MTKLHQLVPLVETRKTNAQAELTELHHLVQKSGLLDGFTRTYRPVNDDGEKLPSESKKVQVRIGDVIKRAKNTLTGLIDLIATQDTTNTKAFADIVVDGVVVAEHVPAVTMLFLDKNLTDLATFVSKLPILDPADSWSQNDEMDCYATGTTEAARTKKIPRPVVKYQATKEHPAQVEMFTEDVLVGYWSTTKFSGAIFESDRRAMLERISKLQDAVKTARGQANDVEVEDLKIAKGLLDFVFDKTV